MALADEQLLLLREELGSVEPPDDGDLDDLYARKGGLVGVIRAVWSQRYADILANPVSISVSGQVSVNYKDNLDAIMKRLGELSGLPDSSDEIPPGGVTLVQVEGFQLVRPDPSR